MLYLITFLLALPSGVFWFVNAEVMVVTQVTQHDAVPWLVALLTTFGQFIGYSALFLFADKVLARAAFVRRAVAKAHLRTPGWGTYAVFATGGLMGLPPLLALFTLYGSARIARLPLLLACAMPGRLLWYMGWAYAPNFIRDNFGWFH